jgi:iron complex outermembrane recepter protein
MLVAGKHAAGETRRPSRSVLRAALVAVLLGGTALSAGALAQTVEATSFSIPAQPLASALTSFGQQSGLQVTFDPNIAAGRQSQGLSGSYAPGPALDRILAGTGITYHFSGARTVVLAAVSADGTSGAVTLPPVQVEGHATIESPYGPGTGYVATQSVSGTKTDTPIIETPQSISVITRQQLDDQDVQNVAQALRYTSGVTPELRGSWTRYDQFSSRGFELDSNEFLDGLRLLAGYQATPQIDTSFLDRIEVLKGPSSVLYGSMAPGGMLNMVSKRPTEDAYNEVGIQTGSYGDIEGTFDSSGPLNDDKTLLYRVTGLVRDSGSQVDHEKNQRIAIAPAFTWLIDPATSLTVLTSYQNDPKGGFYDFLPYQGTVVPANGVKIPTSFYTGDLDYSSFQRTQYSFGYQFEHRFDDVWTVRQNLRFMHIHAVDYLLQDNGWDEVGSTIARYAWNDRENVNSLSFDTQAEAKFTTGPLSHTAIFGVDYLQNDNEQQYGNGFDDIPDISLTNPNYHQAIGPVALQRSFEQLQSQVGLYAQDQMRFGHWALVGGVRQDWSDLNTQGKIAISPSSDVSSDAVTGRAGLVYLFDNGLAPYFSYSTSFNPQAGTDFLGAPFKPTTGEQYEAGVKYQPPGKDSFITASAFQVTEQNVVTADPDPTHPFSSIQTGEIRSRGIELEAHANVTDDLSLIAAYTYLDPKVTEDTTFQGEQPVQVAKNAASLWGDYTFHNDALAGLGLGGGVRYIGSTFADQANTLKVPSFTLFDAAVHYDLAGLSQKLAGAQLSVNISNLFDKTYVSSCDSEFTCYYGVRRTVLANLKYRF